MHEMLYVIRYAFFGFSERFSDFSQKPPSGSSTLARQLMYYVPIFWVLPRNYLAKKGGHQAMRVSLLIWVVW